MWIRLNQLEEEAGVMTPVMFRVFPALEVGERKQTKKKLQEVAVSLTFTGVGWLTRHTFTKPTS